MIKYQARVYKDGRRYSVEFPEFPGCFSDGATKEKALANAKEALGLRLEEARDPKWRLPEANRHQGKEYYWITPTEDVAIPLMIRDARLKHGYTQRELAKLLKMSIQQLQKLETPGKSNPTVRTLAMISRALQEEILIVLAA